MKCTYFAKAMDEEFSVLPTKYREFLWTDGIIWVGYILDKLMLNKNVTQRCLVI